MNSLRGVFPKSQPPRTTRNFLLENIRKVSKNSKQVEQQTPIIKTGSCLSCGKTKSKSIETSSQTSDPADDFFLKDAIIRFPSGYSRGEVPESVEFSEKSSPLQQAIQEEDEEKEELEEEIVTTKECVLTGEFHKPGQIPKYLLQRKKELEREKAINDGPPNHLLLTETERLEVLDLAQKSYDKLITELNKLPITVQTVRVKTRKIAIEKELEQLENTIRIFSRSKVFVNLTK